jgi:hypothetical protein
MTAQRFVHQELIDELSPKITDIAVAESVYLRYRNLCDQIHEPEMRNKFLTYSLLDGVIFDVRI